MLSEAGPARAEHLRRAFVEVARRLSHMPGMGHTRADLTERPVLFWSVHDLLVAYRPDTRPIEIVRVIHGARGPEALRRELEA